MNPVEEGIKLSPRLAKIKEEFEKNMLPHVGHTIIYKVRIGQVAKGRLRRITFDPTIGLCAVWYDGKPFPVKSYYDMVIKCETCSSKTIA